ncbi:MAG: LlaJI family restriction endonuclease [Candidatus Izemoplasmatales bacterium]|nr:LlaJI family restriction endonuclease [Candidatus Izemoplasmatales bacterium]
MESSTSANKKINNLICHASSGREDDSFVGLRIKGNDIYFYYPQAFSFDENSSTIRDDILLILKTISLAKTKNRDKAETYQSRENECDFALNSYLWIINDFLSNGFYINREKTFKTNQNGRVNWKRTLKTNPMISNSNVIYKDIVVETKNNADNLLVEIHRYCVKKSIDFIGWIFNLNSKFIQQMPFNDSIKKLYVSTLNKELDKTFDDYKRLRLTHLKNVILGLDANLDGKDFVYGVDSYHYVFESMINNIFGNIKNLSEFNPKAVWKLKKYSYKEIPSSELRPDTILIKDNVAYIIDSKFYRFGITGNPNDLPETTSIQKQITYGDFIKNNNLKDVKEIHNAFLIPFDKTKETFKTEDNLVYIGYSTSTWRDGKNHHEIIHTFLIDLRHVTEFWNKHNHDDDIQALINGIVDADNEIKNLASN